jgi:hypothetical protein
MSSSLPTLLMFMTTKGQCGARMIYRATLDHIDRDLPLCQWGARAVHIKVSPGEEGIAEMMKADLVGRGFEVVMTTAPWVKGMVHFTEYAKDQIRMSQHPAVCDNPLVYWTDSDYLAVCHRDTYPKVLSRMCRLVESNPETLTARFLREEDKDSLAPDRTVAVSREWDLAWSKHVNFQPLVMRSRDFHRACKVIEDNWSAAETMHGEALWREVLAPFSRSERKHAVWLPEYSVCANLGVPDYTAVAQRFNLIVDPNPS